MNRLLFKLINTHIYVCDESKNVGGTRDLTVKHTRPVLLESAAGFAGYAILTPAIFVSMMTSSNWNIFRVSGPSCGEFTGHGEFPAQRPETRSFDVFFDLRLNTRLSKQSWGWWFETLSRQLWRHCNALLNITYRCSRFKITCNHIFPAISGSGQTPVKSIRTQLNLAYIQQPGGGFRIKMLDLISIWIPVINIRCSHDCFILKMEIAKPRKAVVLLGGPWIYE